MVGPILDRRFFTRQLRQLAGKEIAEALAGHIVIAPIAIDEIHRHIEGVVDIALEAEAVFEDEGQHAGAVGIGIAPNSERKVLKPLGLPSRKGELAKSAVAIG